MIQVSFWEEINAIRRLLSKPKMKSPSEAKEAFLAYIQEKHAIESLDSERGKAYLKKCKEWESLKGLLNYMGIG